MNKPTRRGILKGAAAAAVGATGGSRSLTRGAKLRQGVVWEKKAVRCAKQRRRSFLQAAPPATPSSRRRCTTLKPSACSTASSPSAIWCLHRRRSVLTSPARLRSTPSTSLTKSRSNLIARWFLDGQGAQGERLPQRSCELHAHEHSLRRALRRWFLQFAPRSPLPAASG